MAEHRRLEPLSDEPVDLELDALLAVDPSPEFLARVRMRVATETMGPRPLFEWRWIAVGASTIAIATAIVVLVSQQPTPAVAPATGSTGIALGRTRIAEVIPRDREVVPQNATAAAAPPRIQRARQAERPVPEVLVSPSEAAGLQHLLTALREGRIDPSAVPRDQAWADSEMPITISPIIVEPLSIAADLE